MFDNRFIAFLADTDESRSIHYNIRYQVFCEETGFEDYNAFSDKEEKDDYDQKAAHFIVLEKSTRQWVAAMRLIHGCDDGILPTEDLCSSLDTTKTEKIARKEIGEISRLCIVKSSPWPEVESDFSYDVIDGQTGARKSALKESRKESEIFVGLLRALYSWASCEGIKYCYFLISPAMARILRRLNIKLTCVGEKCYHRGMRLPYFVDIEKVRQDLLQYGPVRVAEMLQRGPAYSLYSEFRRSERPQSKTSL